MYPSRSRSQALIGRTSLTLASRKAPSSALWSHCSIRQHPGVASAPQRRRFTEFGAPLAQAGRYGRARLHRPQRTRQVLQRHDVGKVDVAADDEVGAGFHPAPQRDRMPAQAVGLVLGTRAGDGLVHHHHAQLRKFGMLHQSGHTVDLQRGYLAIFVSPGSPGSRGVDANQQEFRRSVHGLEIRPELDAVPPVRAAQARPQVEQRDVVAPWQSQHGHAKAVREGTSGAELRRSGRCPTELSAASTTSCFAFASLLPAASLTTNCHAEAGSITGRVATAPGVLRPSPGSTALQMKCRWRRAQR